MKPRQSSTLMLSLCALAALTLAACSSASSGNGTSTPIASASDAGPSASGDAAPAAAMEIAGKWTYVGVSIGLDSDVLVFSAATMVETVVSKGKTMNATYNILEYDAAAHHIKAVLGAKDAGYPYDVGMPFFGTYLLNGSKMTLYYSETAYPNPSGGTEGKDYFFYERAN